MDDVSRSLPADRHTTAKKTVRGYRTRAIEDEAGEKKK
jgi:hypothetical protein